MPSLPTTFKKASFKEKGGRLCIEEALLQRSGKNEILVKVEACGVCHSDVFVQQDAYGIGLYVTALISIFNESRPSLLTQIHPLAP